MQVRFMRTAIGAAAALALLASCGGTGTTKSMPDQPRPDEGAGTPSATASAEATPGGGPLPAVSADPALAQEVPSALAKDGAIEVGTDSTYAPDEFLAPDGKTVEGFDVDLFDAVAAKLGLKAHFVSAPFSDIIPSIDSGRYGIGVSSFSITPDRLKTVDMVSYYVDGTQWATATGNPAKVSPDDACGLRIAVQTGTTQADDAAARSKTCTTAGKKAIKLDQYQGQDQATAAVVSGKDDAMLADSPVVAYAVQQTGGKLSPLGDAYAAAPYGYVLKKGSALAKPVADAVNELIEDGTYERVLARWGVGDGAVQTSQVNPKV